ncbi:MAG: hypothetical protein ACR2GW_04405 [Pyrinomonadaceae bacterium]
MQTIPDEKRMKELLEDALNEFFEERQDLLREVVADAIEDVALIHAIKEDEANATVSRTEIFSILEGEA